MKIQIGFTGLLAVFLSVSISGCDGGKTEVAAPAAPSALTAAAVSATQIDLAWQDNSDDESGFRIERKTGGDAYAELAGLPLDATSYSDTGLTPCTAYSYRVYAVNPGGNSAYSNEVTTPTSSLPADPAGFSAQAVPGHQISLSWSAGPGTEDGFEIERKTGNSGEYVSLGTVGAGVLTYADLNLTPGTDYTYRARAFNACGNSGYSGEASARALEPASQVSAGGFHTCALFPGGRVKCWGDNSFGQLGDGTMTSASAPVQVSGLAEEVAAVSAGYTHTCALTRAGGVRCWGMNDTGQLGAGNISGPEFCRDNVPCSRLPVEALNPASGISLISAGAFHTCALTGTGGLKCWGDNEFGQLGDGTTTPRGFPGDVSAQVFGVTGVSAGAYHTCSVTAAGAVQCWGLNDFGQLGTDPAVTPERCTSFNDYCSTVPIPVLFFAGFSPLVDVASGGMHTCALNYQGGTQCWGYDEYWQLGDGSSSTYTYISQPVCVSMTLCNSGVAGISAGNNHTCALMSGGALKCWGHGGYGQLGDGLAVNWNNPTPVSGLASGVEGVSAGGGHTCAWLEEGWVKCWGDNDSGQLGDGTQIERDTPALVTGAGP